MVGGTRIGRNRMIENQIFKLACGISQPEIRLHSGETNTDLKSNIQVSVSEFGCGGTLTHHECRRGSCRHALHAHKRSSFITALCSSGDNERKITCASLPSFWSAASPNR